MAADLETSCKRSLKLPKELTRIISIKLLLKKYINVSGTVDRYYTRYSLGSLRSLHDVSKSAAILNFLNASQNKKDQYPMKILPVR